MIFGVRKWPVVPTLVVLAAAAVMVMLGFWQLDRLDEKEAMLAEFARNSGNTEIGNPSIASESHFLYRKVRIDCARPFAQTAIAGRNDRGRTGYVHQFTCRGSSSFGSLLGDDIQPALLAVIGWSPGPGEVEFFGGAIEGVLVRAGGDFRVVSSEPLAGLEPAAIPNPNDLPNNHLAYAVQWFIFALTALVIYVLALRRRQNG